MPIFESHAHYLDSRFDPDRDALLQSLAAAGVERVMEVACAPADFLPALALADQYPFLYAALGVHPHDADQWDPQVAAQLARLLSRHPKAKALGEIGLDYHYDLSPRPVQRQAFQEQLELARQLDKPVILHVREAYGDAMDILRAQPRPLDGVMHCFSGSPEIARECLELGLYVAFGGAVTFHNANKVLQSAALVPLDRLLLETDCPYMTPVPHRGQRNDSTFLPLIAQKLAELHQCSLAELLDATFQNACRLFRVA